MPFHDQVKIHTPRVAANEWSKPFSSIISVDAGMQDLVKDVWSLTRPDNGYCRTWASCQGGMMPVENRLVNGVLVSQRKAYIRAYVMFQSIFLNEVFDIVRTYGDNVKIDAPGGTTTWPPGWWRVIRFDMR